VESGLSGGKGWGLGVFGVWYYFGVLDVCDVYLCVCVWCFDYLVVIDVDVYVVDGVWV